MSAVADYKCPACGKVLAIDFDHEGAIVWCANGQCKDIVCDVGAAGSTASRAFANLEELYHKTNRPSVQ